MILAGAQDGPLNPLNPRRVQDVSPRPGEQAAAGPLGSLASTYDGPVFITDVGSTLTNPDYFGLPYVGAQDLLNGVAAQGVPIVYLACSDADKEATTHLAAGTVLEDIGSNPDAFKQQAVQWIRDRYPQAKPFLLGNDQGDDAATFQASGGQVFIRNVSADQAHVPSGFKGVLRDVYSPELIQLVADSLKAARAGQPMPTAGPNPPPIPAPSKFDRIKGTVGKYLKDAEGGAELLAGGLQNRLRGGLHPVRYAAGQSDDALQAFTADQLGALGSRILHHMKPTMSDADRQEASAQFLRVVTAHGSDAGHIEAILFRGPGGDAPDSTLDPATAKQLQALRQKDHPPVPGDWAGFETFLDAATGTRRQAGTKVEPFIDGQTAFRPIYDALEHAQSSIDITVYAFQSDETGWDVARRLADAADRGCQVRLLYDVLGSSESNKLPTDPGIFDFLRQHGVALIARPEGPLNTERTHRKIIVVDGTTGFVGGMNLGNEYRNDWHDVHARITGPAVADLQRLFVDQWELEGGHIDPASMPALFPQLSSQPGAGGGRIIGHDGRNDVSLKLAYLRAIDTAEKSINIANPYFADRDVLNHLLAAARRGVEVNLVFPYVNDYSYLQLWDRNEYPKMLAAGIHVWEYYDREMAHEKVATFDSKVATLGSSNLEQESMFANYESNVWTSDPSVIQKLETDLFAKDFTNSYPITQYQPGTLDKLKYEVLKILEKNWL